MSFSEYFNAMSSLGQAIGQAALEPAQTKLKVSELEKAEAAKKRYKEAALASPVLRDRELAAAQIDAGQNISGDLFKTQKTGGGGGGINSLALSKQLAKEKWAKLVSMYHEEIKDPVKREQLDPVIKSELFETAALVGQMNQLTTYDQAFANASTLAGSDFMQQKNLTEASKDVGAAIQNVIVPGLKDMGYDDEQINSVVNNKALLLDATRKLVLEGSTKDVASQSIESFYKLGGKRVLQHQAEMASAFASFDSSKLADLSQSEGLTTEQKRMAAGLSVLKDMQEQLGADASESSYELNDNFQKISDSMYNVIRKNSTPLEERMKPYKESFTKSLEKSKKIRKSEDAEAEASIPANIPRYTPPTKDQVEALGYPKQEEENDIMLYQPE